LLIFMSGVGLVLSFSQNTGWRIVSSFPFMLRFERPGGDLKNLRAKAVGFMGEAYKGAGAAGLTAVKGAGATGLNAAKKSGFGTRLRGALLGAARWMK
jgi:hypothetical protein